MVLFFCLKPFFCSTPTLIAFDGLWRSKFYHPYLVGSVIVLLRIGDLKSILADKSDKALADFSTHQKTIKTLRTYDELEKNYLKNLALINDAKKAIYYRYLHC